MRKLLLGLLLTLAIATPVYGYTVVKGDTPFKLWGENWKTELAKYGISDPRKLPVGLEVELNDGMLGATPTPTSSANRKYVESPDFYLYSPAVAGDTTITLNTIRDIYGNALTMTDLGALGYGRIDPDSATISESITFSGITANSDGTYTLTGVKSALAKYPYTQTSGLKRSHSINAIFRLTNTAAFYDGFANKENDEIVEGAWSFKNDIMNIGSGTPVPAGWRYNSSTNQLEFRRANDSYRVMPTQLRGTYADYASLPSTGNSEGDIAITTDDSKLYVWDDSGSTWVLAGGSSGAGTVYKTEKLGSESDGGDLKTFSLTSGSWPDEKFLLVYKNGQLQRIGATNDYTEVDSDTIEFTYTLASDDLITMIVVSIDLYNPAWGSVTEDIVPDTDNAHDLGSLTKTWKKLYTKLATSWNWATSTPTANYVPIAGAGGKLDNDWLNVTTTPTASLIPLGNTSGQVSADWVATSTFVSIAYTSTSVNQVNGTSTVDINCGFSPSYYQLNYKTMGYNVGDARVDYSLGQAYYSSTTLISHVYWAKNTAFNANLTPVIFGIDNTARVKVGDYNSGVAWSIESFVYPISVSGNTIQIGVYMKGANSCGTSYIQSFNVICYK